MCHPLERSNIIHRRKKWGGTGGMYPQDFAVSKEVPFFQKMAPFSRKKVPKFEMLPTYLILFHANSSSQEVGEIGS